MASVVAICNMSLSHIGSDARITSISPPDGSVEAGHCATFYDIARTELLEPGHWPFSLKRASLSQVTNDSDAWLYAYAKPSDCLRPLRVLTPNVIFTPDGFEVVDDDSISAPYTVEGTVLYSNEPDAVLLYVHDVTDTTKFTPSFTSAFSYLLGAYVAGPVIKGNEGMKIGDMMRQRALQIADVSATASANASATAHNFIPSSVIART